MVRVLTLHAKLLNVGSLLNTSTSTIVIYTLVLFLLAGCGWQLKGQSTGQSLQQPIKITIQSDPDLATKLEQSESISQIRRYLRRINADFAKTDDANHRIVNYDVRVINYVMDDRTVTINSSNRVRQRSLNVTFTYLITSITSNDDYQINVQRYYFENEVNLLASEAERRELLNDIYEEIAQQLWLQIQRLNLTQLNAR